MLHLRVIRNSRDPLCVRMGYKFRPSRIRICQPSASLVMPNDDSCEGRIESLSLWITVCHHAASLVMPNGDPGDGFFYPSALMIDSYLCFVLKKAPINFNILNVLIHVFFQFYQEEHI